MPPRAKFDGKVFTAEEKDWLREQYQRQEIQDLLTNREGAFSRDAGRIITDAYVETWFEPRRQEDEKRFQARRANLSGEARRACERKHEEDEEKLQARLIAAGAVRPVSHSDLLPSERLVQKIRAWVPQETKRLKDLREKSQGQENAHVTPISLAPMPAIKPSPVHTAFSVFRKSDRCPPSSAAPLLRDSNVINVGAFNSIVSQTFQSLSADEQAEYQRIADELNASIQPTDTPAQPEELRARSACHVSLRLASPSDIFVISKAAGAETWLGKAVEHLSTEVQWFGSAIMVGKDAEGKLRVYV